MTHWRSSGSAAALLIALRGCGSILPNGFKNANESLARFKKQLAVRRDCEVRRDWPIYQVLCKCSAVHLGVAVHSGPLGFLLFSCLCSWDDCKQATSGAPQELVCATIECTCGSKQHYLAPCDVSMQCCLPRDHVYTAWPDSKPSLVKGVGVATSTCFRAPRPFGFMVPCTYIFTSLPVQHYPLPCPNTAHCHRRADAACVLFFYMALLKGNLHPLNIRIA
jgi:hypothetical protein